MKCILYAFFFLYCVHLSAQQDSLASKDTIITYQNQAFTLSDVVVRNHFSIEAFIDYVKNDTTFFKAFKNLRLIGFSAYNDILFLDKKGNTKATLVSTTRQNYTNGCRTMEKLEEKTTGDFYTEEGKYNYTTAELYASLFFTNGKVCGENNIVNGRSFSAKGKIGIQKHKEQLKQLFFNPGTQISGLPFIGNKVALFDEKIGKLYDYRIDRKELRGQTCFVFTITPKNDLSYNEQKNIVIDEMVTWFNASTMDIIARNYKLSYNAGIYDFDVAMQVELEKVKDLLVPKVLRFNGDWDIIFKKKERAIFTATLFDFKVL